MKITPHQVDNQKCKLCLPHFEAEAKKEQAAAMLMNRFTERISEKILSFTESPNSNVRNYTADFSTDQDNDILVVHIHLSTRLLCAERGIKLCKRSIVCCLKGSRLISVNTED